jgi:CubicO group peptidase (beta-lactamase class C family)
MESRGIPGLAIAVVYDQEPVYTRGFGLADLEKKTPVTPQTVFRIASITKTFTATAVMILRDRGKLQLHDPVAKYLPWFSYKNRFPEGPVVTIRQLLTHTSGLPRESSFPYWTDYKFPTRDEMIKALASQESIFEPETKLKYSNLGIAILGEVVAAVAGEPYDAFITKEILKPLGMASTSVFPTAAQGGRFATGYGRRFPDGRRDKSPFMDSKGITPAANISSTVEDMAKYASFHLTEGRKPGSSVLKPSTLREMHRVHWLNSSWEGGWGLGFSVNKGSERTTYGHGGWVGGNRSQLLISPKEKVGVIVMVNADDGIPSFFASRAMNMLAPVLSRLGTKPEKEVPADSSWSKYVGLYTDPSGWDTEILIRKGKLMMYGYSYPPEENPINSLVELTPEGKDTFRMTADGGSGELVVFEMGPDGKVVRVKAEENYMYPKK